MERDRERGESVEERDRAARKRSARETSDSRNPDLTVAPLAQQPQLYNFGVRNRDFIFHRETRATEEREMRKKGIRTRADDSLAPHLLPCNSRIKNANVSSNVLEETSVLEGHEFGVGSGTKDARVRGREERSARVELERRGDGGLNLIDPSSPFPQRPIENEELKRCRSLACHLLGLSEIQRVEDPFGFNWVVQRRRARGESIRMIEGRVLGEDGGGGS